MESLPSNTIAVPNLGPATAQLPPCSDPAFLTDPAALKPVRLALPFAGGAEGCGLVGRIASALSVKGRRHATAADIAAIEQLMRAGRIRDEQGHDVCELDMIARLQLETVLIYRPIRDEGPKPDPLPVLAQAPGVIAVSKPHGLATLPRGQYVARSAVVLARRQFNNSDIVPAHRLDRLTGGVLLLITAPEARRGWQMAFAQRRVSKRYEALSRLGDGPGKLRGLNPYLDGQWHELALRLEKPTGSLRMQVVPGPANSLTRFRVKDLFTQHGQRYIWWELAPLTGKNHQIRAHLSHLGYPILGDPLYPEVLPAQHRLWGSEIVPCEGIPSRVPDDVHHLYLCSTALKVVDHAGVTQLDVHL